ncbi:MAG: hypothetical protein AAFQ20_00265 [Bacteroidota bacterium]
MAKKRPNMDMVEKVRSRLESEGKLDAETMTTIKGNLEKKRNATFFMMFNKRRELDETISALDYLLENHEAQD